jgi:hypothetical protein
VIFPFLLFLRKKEKTPEALDFTGFSEILVLIISLMKSADFTPFFPFILARY